MIYYSKIYQNNIKKMSEDNNKKIKKVIYPKKNKLNYHYVNS